MKFQSRVAVIAALGVGIAVPSSANHSWNGYHWSKPGAQVVVPIERNLSSEWVSHFDKAVTDWNASSVIQSSPSIGTTNPRNCRAVSGRIEVCNSSYGSTGWLGIAQISLSGGHIVQGTTKLNDTYFNTAKYNTPAWRALVTCQEIGHDYGLGHQDEDFANADVTTNGVETCMDYTNLPAGNGQPNGHDYNQLVSIYSHADAAAALGAFPVSSAAGDGDIPAEWGQAIHFTKDGRPDVFRQVVGRDQYKLTHVFWAIGEGPRAGR